MSADRDALGNHIGGQAFGFVEQVLLLDRDILRPLLRGSAEKLTLQAAIFLFEEAHPMGQMCELFSQIGCFHASRDLIAGAAKRFSVGEQ
jgi:hypothetical protein